MKRKALAQIYKIMRKNRLSTIDVKNYVLQHSSSLKSSKNRKIDNEFDLLCLIEDRKVRVSFSSGHLGTPLAIFPFKNEPTYIELDEVDNKKHTDSDVDEDRLLDEKFCSRVFKIKDKLNWYLKAINKPILKGGYLADSDYMPHCGWIVGFDDEYDNMPSDYFGGSLPAKLRYMGRFDGECVNL